MYERYYGFSKAPFGINPDPHFLYLNPNYREAIAILQYGIQERKGIVTLIGEVGTGKTMLLNQLLESLEQGAETVVIPTTEFTYDDLIDYLLNKLQAPPSAFQGKTRFDALRDILLARNAAGDPVVVLVDEAQDLDTDTLENIRLLSNLETPSQKLLQIVLVGQPELRHKLSLPELRQLKQRIAISFTLQPLSANETPSYVAHRLRGVGYLQGTALFSDDALELIGAYSKGIPRLVNAICDNALLSGFAGNKRWIDAPLIQEAANDLMLERLETGTAAEREKVDVAGEVGPLHAAGGRRTSLYAGRWLVTIAISLLAVGAGYLGLRFGSAQWQDPVGEFAASVTESYRSGDLSLWSFFGDNDNRDSSPTSDPQTPEIEAPAVAFRLPNPPVETRPAHRQTDAPGSQSLSDVGTGANDAYDNLRDSEAKSRASAPAAGASALSTGVQEPRVLLRSPVTDQDPESSSLEGGEKESAAPASPFQSGPALTPVPILQDETTGADGAILRTDTQKGDASLKPREEASVAVPQPRLSAFADIEDGEKKPAAAGSRVQSSSASTSVPILQDETTGEDGAILRTDTRKGDASLEPREEASVAVPQPGLAAFADVEDGERKAAAAGPRVQSGSAPTSPPFSQDKGTTERGVKPREEVSVAVAEPVSTIIADSVETSRQELIDSPGLVKTLKAGDSITSVARPIYGDVGLYELAAIKIANPGIRDLDRVEQGLEVVLPDLSSGVLIVYGEDGSANALLGVSSSLAHAEHLRTVSAEKGVSVSVRPDKLSQTIEIYRLETSDFKGRLSVSARMSELRALRTALTRHEE